MAEARAEAGTEAGRRRVRALTAVSAALTSGGDAGLERALRSALDVVETAEVEETLLQSYLFLGYPAALRGFAAWRRISGRAAPSRATADEDVWERRGEATCGRVYGGQYERLRRNIAALHPDMERWMVMEGYGKVLGRPGLDLATRELCIVALLAGQDAVPQLYSHLRGALNAGADEGLVGHVVEQLLELLPPERAVALTEQWAAVRARRGT
jgi:4-carboxymuconolactone decarboxylase